MTKFHSFYYFVFVSLASIFFATSIDARITDALEMPVTDVNITPHKALYEIKLHKTKSGSKIINIEGDMLFSSVKDCEGWVADHQFTLNYSYTNAPGMKITSDFSTFENNEGTSFVFSSSRKRDGVLFEELRGSATVMDGKTQIDYILPQESVHSYDEVVLFPMQHTMAVLKAANTGQKFINASVFEGSDLEGPLSVNAFLTRNLDDSSINIRYDAAKLNKDIDASLLTKNSINARLAFFPQNKAGAEPEYEVTYELHENGIISNMLVEYKDFSITQNLIAVEELKEPVCN